MRDVARYRVISRRRVVVEGAQARVGAVFACVRGFKTDEWCAAWWPWSCARS